MSLQKLRQRLSWHKLSASASGFDRPRLLTLLALGLLALLAIWPLIIQGPPLQDDAVTDGPNHLYRFAELAWHIEHGDLYPRWFANLHYGFGAPLLNFYSPLSYYILLAWHGLGFSMPTAFLLGFATAITVAIFGMYVWVNAQFDNRPAGLLAAAAYGFAPYLYFSTLERAAHPEMWALALAPWLFWALLRLVRQPTCSNRVTLTLIYAALILTHNLSAVLFTPLLLVYGAVTLMTRPTGLRRAISRLSLSLGHGVALAAFFVVPFLLESADVQLERAARYDYSLSFLAPSELFSAPLPFDRYHVRNPIPISLAWPPLLLALAALGVPVLRWRKMTATRWSILANGVMFIILVFLIQDISAAVWAALPPMSIIQFPFRLVGPATFLLAWLAGAAIAMLPLAPRLPLAAGFVAGTFLFAQTWTFHSAYDSFPAELTPEDIITAEMTYPRRVGATNLQEFLPKWVAEMPAPDTLLPRYAETTFPSRLPSLPPGVAVLDEQYALNTMAVRYTALEAFDLTLYQFYFPGWVATLDGAPQPLGVSNPNGLITLALPAGEHTLLVALRPSPAQTAGNLLSLLALLALFVPLPRRLASVAAATAPAASVASPAQPLVFVVLFVALLGLRISVIDRVETPFAYTARTRIEHPLAVNFDGQLLLIGLAYPKSNTGPAGSTMDVQLYWQALADLDRDYQVTVQLVDAWGNRFGQSDNQHPGDVPTSRWEPEQYARDIHLLTPLAGTPPGEYHLMVAVYSLREDFSTVPLGVRGVGGNLTGLEYDLGLVTVTRGQPQPAAAVHLVEGQLAGEIVGVGDQLVFSTLWHAGSDPLPPLLARLTLTTPGGQTLYTTDIPPARPDYPTGQWTPNELVRYPHAVTLPPDLPATEAEVTLALVDAGGTPFTGYVELGRVSITVPERTFDVPPMTYQTAHEFNGAIRLLGYDRSAEDITLYWQALQAINARLTVFVHRLDDDGGFIAGHDSPPPRPTTSWLPGEVITDVHPLDVGAHFQIGLYDPLSGARFGQPLVVGP